MRRRVLLKSVERLIPTETLYGAAMLWRMHRQVVPITIAAVVAAAAIGLAIDVDLQTGVLVTAASAAAAAGLTREYLVLALTDDGFVLMRGSTIRVQAIEILERRSPDMELRKVGGSLLTAEWRVADETYTVRREWQRSMEQMAAQAQEQ